MEDGCVFGIVAHVSRKSQVAALYRVGSSVIEGRPVRVKLRLFACPYCGAAESRRSKRSRTFEKPLAFFIWPRRCRGCGHRYYSPMLWCVRPNSFWAIVAVLTVAAAAAGFLWFVSGVLSPDPVPMI